jgi:hypothetical protein
MIESVAAASSADVECKYLAVIARELWPRRIWTVRIEAPDLNQVVAAV